MKSKDSAIKKIVVSRGRSLGVRESVWREALSRTTADEVAAIRHAALDGDSRWRTHVAEIPLKVTCHVHFIGDEVYEVVAGAGILHYGLAGRSDGVLLPDSSGSVQVTAGDFFMIPEGYAHQLVRLGAEPLIILFACPDDHLGSDRIALADF